MADWTVFDDCLEGEYSERTGGEERSVSSPPLLGLGLCALSAAFVLRFHFSAADGSGSDTLVFVQPRPVYWTTLGGTGSRVLCSLTRLHRGHVWV